ncbi:MAG: hypothetical protein J5496_07675 [Lachnospiraceae bacterium]|nr:hypothetical protein [Lachnospiraceae bacterium]
MADFNETLRDLNNTADHTDEFDPSDIEQNKFMAILAYLSWLVLIPLFAAKGSRFARFHCNQGIVLAIAEIIAWALFGILKKIPLIGWIFGALSWILSLICLVMAVIGIINAVGGKAKDLPVIGSFRILS